MKRIFTLAILIIFVFTLAFFSLSQTVKAAPPIITVTPQSSATSTSVNYCLGWVSQDDLGVDDAIAIAFADFDITSLEENEVYFYNGSSDCTTGGRQGENPAVADNDRDGVYTFISSSTYAIVMEDAVSNSTAISIGLVVDSGDTLVTPAVAGNYNVAIGQYYALSDPVVYDWFEQQLIYIGNANEVEISAAVEPSISLSLSDWKDYSGSSGTANTCDLGTLSSTNISTCSYKTTIATNASNGYTASIVEDQAMTSGTDTLTAASGTVTANSTVTEAYGVSTTQATQTITQVNDADTSSTYTQADCDTLTGQSATNANASGLSTSNQTYASSSGSTASDEITLCHAVTVAGTTPAGLYSHTVTITVVGNF